ncbi:PAS domain S-box protein [Polaribacter sp. IC073]|uniref:PAS domain-containing sensor histidine kinase n=1 Tax=Polaribacter sp. IC073 TaxID=2508540 RepID=UPI0011BF8DAD|nr:PAS domain S-box protein [Polaribacter sp. IC073]TXD46869.1 PAS domain S-box protein [Polaribacter sp. IC073]
MDIELLKKALKKEKKARKDAERITEEKSLALYNSVLELKEMDILRTASESIAAELRQFIKTANVPVFGIDSKGLVNEWNQATEKLSGFGRAEMLGKNLTQYITKEYQEAVQEVLNDALLGKETANYELPVFTKDGQRLVLLLNLNTCRNTSGIITGVLGVGRDVTERALQNEEEEKRANELVLANKELTIQNEEEEKRADKLIIANEELVFQNEEEEKRADELIIANKELAFQNEEKEKKANELVLANAEIILQKELSYRSEMERIAYDLTLLIETVNAPIFGVDNKGLINKWNEASEKITGFSKEDVLGKNLVQTYISEDQRASVKKVLDNGLLGKQTNNYQLPLLTKDGQPILVLLNSSTRRDAHGEITGVLGVGQDITEQKKASQYARSLIEASLDPLVTISPEGKITDVNEASAKVTGIPRDALIGTDFSNYFTEPDKARAGYKKVFDEGSVSDYPLTIRNQKGKLTDVLYNASVYKDDKGNVLGVFASARDVTAQKQASQYARSLIEASLDPLVTISPEGIITDVNEALEKVTGVTRDELIGTDFSNYFTEPEEARAGYKKVFDEGSVSDYPLTIRDKKGKLIDVLYNASVYRDDKGNVLGVFAAARDVTTQKQASQYARSLIEASLDPLVTISLEGIITDVNEALEKVTGVSREALIGTDFSNYFTEPEKARTGYKKVFEEGSVSDYALTILDKKGKLTDVLYNASVYKDDKGNVLGVFAAARDITELNTQNKEREKRAIELANLKVELEQQIVCLNESAIVSEADAEGNIIFANDKFCEISGYKREELIGQNHRILKSGKQPNGLFIGMWAAISSGKVWKGEVMNKKKGANEFYWVDTTIMPFKDVNGKIIKYVGIRFDITKQVEQKENLLKQAEELRQFIETANAPIFGIDSEGLVNEWNQTSVEITGYTKNDVLGKDLVQTYITEDYRESVKKVLDDALLGKETANYEFPLFTKDGQRVMVLLNSSTRRDSNGKITGVLGVGQDITELVGYRNELETKVNERTLELNEALKKEKELSELKSKFVSTASHEFRTPLSAINFAAGSIKKYWAKMEPVMIDKKLHKIEDQVMHMTKLLDDILVVGQAGAGKIRYKPLHVNLGDFINEIIEEVYSSHKKSHEIILIDHEELKNANILIDEKLGRNIFINVIGNAIKFSPDAKKVTIELSSERKHIIISITDYGIGIPKSELENIFQPFTRGFNVDLIQGTGLGLSIAKEAIDIMGGKIIVKSTAGKGTSFIVKIRKK